MLGEAFKRVMEREVPWNDLRQAAVLRRLHKAERKKRAPRAVRWPVFVVAASLLAVVGFVTRGRWLRSPSTAAPALAALPPIGDMLVRLPDGSTARGENSADVKLESLGAERAELVQTAGRIRYDVTPNAHRKFVVHAREVEVSVLGTAFYVDMSAARVGVHVEHGSVEVAQRDRRVVLASGEGITLDTTIASPEPPSTSETSAAPDIALRNEGATSPSAGDTFRAHAGAPSGVSPAQLLERADRARSRGDLAGGAD
jgi:ferric-dicitrate binding protein FerR (iron transport regulator)